MIIEMSSDQYMELNESGGGACLACGEIQEFGLEPDARGYTCETCGEKEVYGAEELLMMGKLEFTDEEGETDGYDF